MKDFLRKIRLIDNFKIELEINKNEFFNILKNNIDEKRSDFFDAFSSSKNDYKGTVTQDSFDIKRRWRFFDVNLNFAKAKGTIEQKGSNLIIMTEINAFQGQMMIFFISLIVFYLIFIIAISTADNVGGNVPGFAYPFILIHALFMFGIPYFIMRRSVSRMKYELERDFYYMIKK
jgi:hypothetical protein